MNLKNATDAMYKWTDCIWLFQRIDAYDKEELY